ncbi:FAD-dependent oxidoreductase, partial [Patescibacteria group bacterium]|nr:FAD-dependent oxidoreductase [Patescibacteria group bacterium]
MTTYLIIGGVAGGASAATRLRRNDERAKIVLVERDPDISYANCGLPYYLGGIISERERLTITTPELLRLRFNIDVRVNTEALAINAKAKKVRLKDTATGKEYDQPYDRLLLATGSTSFLPPIPGADQPGVFTLKTLKDADTIAAYYNQHHPGSVVIIG